MIRMVSEEKMSWKRNRWSSLATVCLVLAMLLIILANSQIIVHETRILDPFIFIFLAGSLAFLSVYVLKALLWLDKH